MIELNLETKNKEQEKIKAYLQNNVSEILADKINNGVKITKDDKTLINKKDLTGFWSYATSEARKQAESGSTGAYVDDEIVYGWAIHYFEEDSIEGKLYNEDGTEYKTVAKTVSKPTLKPEPKKEEKSQQSFFDFMNLDKPKEEMSYKVQLAEKPQPDPLDIDNEECDCEDDWTEEEKQEIMNEDIKPQIHDYYKIYKEQEESYPDIIVLTRLGDFYEAFNENAIKIADILDLTLTSKDVGLENKVKLAGFPYHVKDKYFALLQEQYTILIIENGKTSFIQKIDKTNNQVNENLDNPTFDKYLLKTISSLLDGKVVLK